VEWRIEYKGRDEKRPDLPSLPFTTFKSIPSTVSLSLPSAINRTRDIIFLSGIIFLEGLEWTRDWALAKERENERINIEWENLIRWEIFYRIFTSLNGCSQVPVNLDTFYNQNHQKSSKLPQFYHFPSKTLHFPHFFNKFINHILIYVNEIISA
jgi:hypothetical protein